MINGKNSWKFLVFAFIVLLVTCGAGGIACTVGGTFPKIVGILNMLMGISVVVGAYNLLKEK